MSLTKTCARCAAPLPDDALEGAVCNDCIAAIEAEQTVATPLDGTPSPSFRLPMETPRVEVIGDFEILGKLGQGGMGAVYRARQITLDRVVALKVLPEYFAADEENVGRFQREARIASGLVHANIVHVFSSGVVDGTHFIAMELVEGENLRQRMKRERLSVPEALHICAEVARGLQYGWEHAHLVHRDIKPGNIFLSTAGEVKVGDLGLAKSVSGVTSGLTQTGTSLGTALYMSPEQVRGDKTFDFRSDIYSLGCTLYEMLTGHPPYSGADGMTVMRMHLDAPLPAILKALPGCPMPLVRLVGKMLRKHARERHASYVDLIAEIEHVREQIESGATNAGPSKVVEAWKQVGDLETKPATSYGLLWASLALLLLVGSGITFLVVNKSKKPVGTKLAAKPTAAPVVTSTTASHPSLPSSPSVAGTINLLPLVQLSRDVAGGTWSVKPEGLSLDETKGFGRCEFPYEPPEEYDFEVEFTPKSGGDNVDLHFRASGASVMWKLSAYGRSSPKSAFATLDGRNPHPEASKEGPTLEIGRRYTTRVEVRHTGLRGFLDGHEILSWSGDFKRFTKEGAAHLHNERHLGIGGYSRSILFHRAEVRPVGGTAPVSAAPPAPNEVQTFGGHRYQLVPGMISWHEAKAKAEQMGGHLATITSKEEDDFASGLLPRLLGNERLPLWLGAFAPDPSGGSKKWNWVTGEPYDYSRWEQGEGHDPGETALAYRSDQKWADIPPAVLTNGAPRMAGFLVEWDDAGGAANTTPATSSKTPQWENLLLDPEMQERMQKTNDGAIIKTMTTVARGGGRDGAVRARLVFSKDAANSFRLVACKQDATWYQAQLSADGSGGFIQKVTGSFAGAYRNLPDERRTRLAQPLVEGQALDIELRVGGDALQMSINGQTVYQGRQGELPAGRWGVSVNSNTPVAVQSVEYFEPPSSATVVTATKEAPFVNSLGMKFVPVPITGGPTDGKRVLFSVWETRVQDYEAFAGETQRGLPKPPFGQNSTEPVVNITWQEAVTFCEWLTQRERQAGRLGAQDTYRLPDDHEWSCAAGLGAKEDAAKSPAQKNAQIAGIYSWGQAWPPPAKAENFAGEERSGLADQKTVLEGYRDPFVNTSPVGSFPANVWGLLDLGGNVREFCRDWWDDNRDTYTLRGGHFTSQNREAVQVSVRNFAHGIHRSPFTGFRIVLTPAP